MSSSLLVMAPFVLLAIASSLCFVGCTLNTQGELYGQPLFRYSDDTVLSGESDRLLAFWRLNEGVSSAPGSTAVNSKNAAANGIYASETFLADDVLKSAAAPGTLTFGLAGLLGGDLQYPPIAGSARQPCIFVDGGFVKVAWHPSLAPSELEGFTLEAWVHVDWSDKEPKADRAVVVSLELAGAGFNGFGIRATIDKTWQAFIGTGSGIEFTPGTPLDYDTLYHLVATYEAGQLKLYVNGAQMAAKSATYFPTTGAVSATGAPSQLYIGAGGPHLKAPAIPFVGRMQCVALYRGAFMDTDVTKHFNDGKSGPTS